MEVLFTEGRGLHRVPAMMQEELTQRAVLVGGAQVSVFGRGPGFASGGGGGDSGAFRIKLLGYSFAGVERLAMDLQHRLEAIPRVRNVNINAGSFWIGRARGERGAGAGPGALARAGLTATDSPPPSAREIRGPQGGVRLELEGDEILVSLKAKGARERSLHRARGRDRAQPHRITGAGARRGRRRVSAKDSPPSAARTSSTCGS